VDLDEAAFLRFLAGRLPPRAQHHVIDVGAAAGNYTAEVLASAIPNPVCWTVEPRADAAEALRARFADRPNVHVLELAVSDHDGTVDDFVVAPFAEFSHMRGRFPGDTAVTVTVRTVDRIVADEGIDLVTLLKIDTEGFEPQVIAGARALRHAGLVHAIQLEYGGTWGQGPPLNSVLDELRADGFDIYQVPHLDGRVVRIDGPSAEDLAFRNLLAVQR